MKRVLTVCGLVLFSASALAADKEQGPGALDEAWSKAMVAGDAAAAAALYAPDAVMYPPDVMEVRGREVIQKNYADFLGGVKVLEAKVTPAKMEVHGDTAIAWGRWMVKVAPKAGGEPVVMEGRFTEVAKKIGDRWLYVSDHASAPPPPPPLAAGK